MCFRAPLVTFSASALQSPLSALWVQQLFSTKPKWTPRTMPTSPDPMTFFWLCSSICFYFFVYPLNLVFLRVFVGIGFCLGSLMGPHLLPRPICRNVSEDSCCIEFGGILPGIFLEDFSGRFPTKMRRINPATKSAKKNIRRLKNRNRRKKSVLPKTGPNSSPNPSPFSLSLCFHWCK